jgi:hypothetical protein
MGLLTFEYNRDEFGIFQKLANMFPAVSNQILGYIGNEAKRQLKTQILSGQELDYKGWRDKAGRPKTSYGIKYSKYVTIRSYPANFFTVPNNRQKKRDIWGKLKILTNSQMDKYLKDFDAKYWQTELDKFDANPKSRSRY